MDQHDLLLAALRAHLTGRPLEYETGPVSLEEWNRFFHFAMEHHVLPMVYEVTAALPAFRESAGPLAQEVRYHVLQNVVGQTQRTQMFLAVYQRLRAAGLKPIVVKGLLCRELYPMPDHRVSMDEDVLVPPEAYETCHEALLKMGMLLENPQEDRERTYEVTYINPPRTLALEIHKSLFSGESAAYSSLNQFFADAPARAVEVEIQGQKIWSLAPHDHLLYLLCHAFKHFLHGGFGIRQVCDILLYGRKYGGEVDWPRLYDQCRRERMDRFAAALFAIGETRLGLSLELPPVWRACAVDPEPMLRDLLSSGIYGGADLARKHSSNITLSAVSDQKAGKEGSGSVLKTVFLPRSALVARYTYLEKWPFLLPVAWCQRIFRYLRENRGQGVGSAAAESIRLGRERVALLRQYGILDDEKDS